MEQKQISFRVTEQEYNELTELSEACGEKTLAAFAKTILLEMLANGETLAPNASILTDQSASTSNNASKLPFAELCPGRTPEDVVAELATALVKRGTDKEKLPVHNPYRKMQIACNYYFHGLNLVPVKGKVLASE